MVYRPSNFHKSDAIACQFFIFVLLPCITFQALGQELTDVEDKHYIELSKAECGTLTECARRGYRVVHGALPFLLLEKEAVPPNTYRYIEIPRIDPCNSTKNPQEMLNQAGVFGYRLVSLNDLANGGIMEKPPGRPNQFQYIVIMPRERVSEFSEDYTSRLDRLAKKVWQEGFVVRSLVCGQRSLMERAAEPPDPGTGAAGTEFDANQPYISAEAERSALNAAASLGYRAFFCGYSFPTRVFLGKTTGSSPLQYEYEVTSFRDGTESVQGALDDASGRGFHLLPFSPGCDKLLLEKTSGNSIRHKYLLLHDDPGSSEALLAEINRVYRQGYRVVSFGLEIFGRRNPTLRKFAIMGKQVEPLA